MADRKSVITKPDCVVLTKYMAEAQEAIVKYLSAGTPVTGINDDMWLSTRLITIQNKIQEIRDRRKS